MSDDPVSAEEVAHRRFSYSFRGFDPGEVRAYLDRVAEELRTSVKRERELQRRLADAEHRAAHPVVDESVLTRTLGEETSRIVASAHDVARELRTKAEENAARILREAHAEAERITSSAEGVLAERTEEADAAAEQIRRAAVSEVESSLQQARQQASAIVSEAEAQAARTMKEAEAGSARVLSELARRRRAAQGQIEQLRAGRERLLDAYRLVRRTLEEVVDELQRSEPEARLAAEAATRRAAGELGPDDTEVPEEGVVEVDAPVSAFVAAPPARSVAPPRALPDEAATEPGAGPVPEPVSDVTPLPGAEAGPTRAADLHDEPALESPPISSLRIPAGPRAEPAEPAELAEPAEPDEAAQTGLAQAGLAETAPAEPAEGSPAERTEPEAAEPAERVPAGERGEVGEAVAQPPVSELFARIKADRAAAVARARDALGVQDAPEEPAGPSAASEREPEPVVDDGPVDNGDEALLQRRDAALEAVISGLARRLKRALQDDQNDVLDRLRSHRGSRPAELLPSVEDQSARYRRAGVHLLQEAAAAGADFVAPGQGHEVDIGDLADGLAESLLGPLRRRLDRAVSAEQEEDPTALVESISAAYREWKSQRVDRLAGDAAVSAFSRGTAAAAGGATLRWVVDDDGGPCPDCYDNALAGPTPSGRAYPTGQQHPPAHAGCRCLLVPTTP